MKKLIETKKIFVAVWILSIALFIFPLSSFGGRAIVCPNEGPIGGLEFDFGEEGLTVTLPLGEVTVNYVEVEASGREIIIVTPSGQYIYDAKLGGGTIHGFDGEGTEVLTLDFSSAALNEHFTIEEEYDILIDCEEIEEVVVPPTVDLFFRATLIIDGVSYNFLLKLQHGQVLFPIS